MPIGLEKATRLAAAAAAENYFGDDSDGTVVYSANTNFTVLNKSGSYDGDMLVKQYTDLTINSSVTVTVDQPCRGMLIYCTGDCAINGTLSMTKRGALRNPTDVTSTGLRLPILIDGQTETLAAADFAGTGDTAPDVVANHAAISGDGKIYTVTKVGASPSAGGGGGGGTSSAGDNGTAGQTGGGGGGGSNGGTGGTSTCFSGGSGGGGRYWGDCGCTPNDGIDYGGRGGAGCACYTHNSSVGGAAGNPGEAGYGSEGYNYPTVGLDGTGGLLILMVGGDLSGSGTIEAKGATGGYGHHAGGGASGGGVIIVLHAGSYDSGLTLTAAGGHGAGTRESKIEAGLGDPGSDVGSCGGDGGAGSIQGPTQIDSSS